MTLASARLPTRPLARRILALHQTAAVRDPTEVSLRAQRQDSEDANGRRLFFDVIDESSEKRVNVVDLWSVDATVVRVEVFFYLIPASTPSSPSAAN